MVYRHPAFLQTFIAFDSSPPPVMMHQAVHLAETSSHHPETPKVLSTQGGCLSWSTGIQPLQTFIAFDSSPPPYVISPELTEFDRTPQDHQSNQKTCRSAPFPPDRFLGSLFDRYWNKQAHATEPVLGRVGAQVF
jgi:hypothetical protein